MTNVPNSSVFALELNAVELADRIEETYDVPRELLEYLADKIVGLASARLSARIKETLDDVTAEVIADWEGRWLES